MGVLIFLLMTCAVVPAGAQFLRLTRLAPWQLPERLLMSAAVGYVLLGYWALILGLTHHLTAWSCAVALAVFAVAGLGNWDLLWEGLLRGLNAFLRAFRSEYHAGFAAVMVLLAIGTLLTALAPPGGLDYDGLAEHLAQASHYARHHEVVPLWYDHHSHFPSNMQMLYAITMVFHVPAAAKLFHWFHGMMALVTVFLIARRFCGPRSCSPAMLVLGVSPMFVWLSGMAYVDLAALAYGLLAVMAFLRWHRNANPPDLILASLLSGCGMTVKMQGIALFGVLMVGAVVLVLRRRRHGDGAPGPIDASGVPPTQASSQGLRPHADRSLPTQLKWLALATLVGLLIAAPWYLRSYLDTGNPFYPFAYSIFGGKHWSADRARVYQGHQLEFGLGSLPPQEELDKLPRWRRMFVGPREPWKFVVAPFGLTFLPWEYEVNLGPLKNLLLTSIGPLWLALLPLLLLLRGHPPAVKATLWLFLPLWLWWFMSMQLGRYLLPMLAVLAPAAGYVFARYTRGGRTGSYFAVAAAALATATALYVTVILALPTARVALGMESREAYLLENLDIYEPSHYIATALRPDARIAMYGEVRSYYFQRDVIWAEYAHSDLIPYQQIVDSSQLIRRFRELGVTHVLLNQTYLPPLWTSDDKTMSLLRQAIERGQLRETTTFSLHRGFLLFELAPEMVGAHD